MPEDTPTGLLSAASPTTHTSSKQNPSDRITLPRKTGEEQRGVVTSHRRSLSPTGRTLGVLPPVDHFLEAGLWERLIEGSETVCADAGELLYTPSTAPRLLAILEGVARVFIWTAAGRQVTLRYARPGDLVGLPAALGPTSQTSAVAVTDTVVALLSVDRLRELSARHVNLAWPIAKQMARWGGDVDLNLVDLEHRPMTARIAGHLLESTTRKTGGGSRARISQEHLAAAAGTVREVAARSLADLRDAGLVVTRRGTVLIVDRVGLSQVAGGGGVGGKDDDLARSVRPSAATVSRDRRCAVAGARVTIGGDSSRQESASGSAP